MRSAASMRSAAILVLSLCVPACDVALQSKPYRGPPDIGSIVPGAEPPRDTTVALHGDMAYTLEERKQLLAAAELWRLQTSGMANISIVWDADFTSEQNISDHVDAVHNLMGRFTSKDDAVVNMEADGGNLLGFVLPSGGIHNPGHSRLVVGFVVDYLDGSEPRRAGLTQVALHEFGHVLGVPHLPSAGGIMFGTAVKNHSVCLKKSDLSGFCSVNECGVYPMVPCE